METRKQTTLMCLLFLAVVLDCRASDLNEEEQADVYNSALLHNIHGLLQLLLWDRKAEKNVTLPFFTLPHDDNQYTRK